MRRTDKAVPFDGGSYDRVTYRQQRLAFPFIGAPAHTATYVGIFNGANAPLDEREIAWLSQTLYGGAVHQPLVARVADWVYEGGAVVSASETVNTYTFTGNDLSASQRIVTTGSALSDPAFTPLFWGHVPDRTVSSPIQTVTSAQSFSNWAGGNDWRKGFVSQVDVTFDAPGLSARSQRTTFTAEGNTTAIDVTTRFPLDPDLEAITDNDYDAYGNLTAVQLTARGVQGGSPHTVGSASGYLDHRYPGTTTNALGQSTTAAYDVRFGSVRQSTDPNGLTSLVTRDAFGRVTTRQAPDGTTATISYADCVSACTQVTWGTAVRRITTTVTHGATQVAPSTTVYLDVLGRELLNEREPFNGSAPIRIETHYDARGRVTKTSLPYIEGATPVYTTFAYDRLGRVIREDRPDGGATVTAYSAGSGTVTGDVTETVVDPACQANPPCESQSRRSTFDALGRITETVDGAHLAPSDPDRVETLYTYDVLGNLDTVTVAGESVADIDYDIAGNRTRIVEPNTGTSVFEVDALGRVARATDAKGQITEFSYDALGRLTQRIDDAGGAAQTSTWSWDTGRIGLLASRAHGGFSESLDYDSLSRVTRVTTTLDSGAIGDPSFTDRGPYVVAYSYDGAGRLETVTYPGGIAVSHEYSARGYLARIKQGATVLDEYTQMDAFGVITEEHLAGGNLTTTRSVDPTSGRLTGIATSDGASAAVQDLVYRWRSNGTLAERTDRRGAGLGDDTTETFGYDGLNRLDVASTSGAASRTLGFDYDGFGNLTTKTSSVPGDLEVTGYAYGAAGAPHRLTGATLGGVATSFSYDANGNVTRYDRATGDDTFIAYDARNRATTITVGTSAETATPSARDAFWYGPDGARFLRKATWDAGGVQATRWTVYLDGGVFEETADPGTGTYLRKVQATETALIRVSCGVSCGAPVVEYLLRDHLGSVHRVTDASGTVLSDASGEHTLGFDPYGGRREADASSDLGGSGLAYLLGHAEENTGRGHTDHEHLDRTGLVHRNGRLYDPRLGRFVQADPVVQAPLYSQSYNRYAYVFNDPLSRVDPSGLVSIAHCAPQNGDGCQTVNGAHRCPLIGKIRCPLISALVIRVRAATPCWPRLPPSRFPGPG